jgi:malate synthase
VPEVIAQVTTSKVDPEIATLAGPQLVCPVDNARFALNAANARWGSLLDAFYGTDAVPGDRDGPYNDVRGRLVFDAAEAFLDSTWPLAGAKYGDVRKFALADGAGGKQLVCTVEDGSELGLADPASFIGYNVDGAGVLSSILLVHNDLHCEIQIDPTDSIGSTHPAGMKDIVLESAVTTIMDCEDSVAAVDASDKALVYSNWGGLMRGDLSTSLEKSGSVITRALNPDLTFMAAASGGSEITLPGRSLLLVRNVGIHMYTDAATFTDGSDVPEGLLDAMVTVLAAIPDLAQQNALSNSRTGSIYVVKPKMHGPEEVAYVAEVFGAVEKALGLEHATVKLGIMDEERRTSVNLGACIAVRAIAIAIAIAIAVAVLASFGSRGLVAGSVATSVAVAVAVSAYASAS